MHVKDISAIMILYMTCPNEKQYWSLQLPCNSNQTPFL